MEMFVLSHLQIITVSRLDDINIVLFSSRTNYDKLFILLINRIHMGGYIFW